MTADPVAQQPGERLEDVAYAFRYSLPEEFLAIPDPTREADWTSAAAELMPEASAEEHERYARQMIAALPTLFDLEETLTDVALCLGYEDGDDGYQISMGLLVVAARRSEHTDPLIAAEGVYRAKEKTFFADDPRMETIDFERAKGRQGTRDTLLAAKLPCGPGVMSASVRTISRTDLEAIAAGAGDDMAGSPAMVPEQVPMATLQLIIPAPRDYFVYVTITTPTVALLDSYTGRLSYIARTFSFDVPEADAAE
ncbi:hypothetical protein [Streptomyces boninensis]|uniref:hypothetical protein n=1 Tax=Streptomyces boninensis TaxID=2039455 RepID=UPI003B21859D